MSEVLDGWVILTENLGTQGCYGEVACHHSYREPYKSYQDALSQAKALARLNATARIYISKLVSCINVVEQPVKIVKIPVRVQSLKNRR